MFRPTFVACLAACASASFSIGRSCPDYDRQPNFDATRYTGTWYEVQKDFTNVFDIGAQCTTANYQLKDDGSIQVYNRSVYPTGQVADILGSAVESNVDGPGSLVVDFGGEPDPNRPGNYNVVSTDYDSYAIFYSCSGAKQFGVSGIYESYSLLARTTSLSDEKLAEIRKIYLDTFPEYNYDFYVKPTK